MVVSIITVSYNAEKTIEKTLNSVRKNKNKLIEYIVIDGNSTDNTLNIINKYNDIIDIMVSERDNGLYDALNKGIKLAKGDYCMLLAADDVLVDGALNKAISKIKKNTDIWCGSIIQKSEAGYFIEESSANLEELKLHCSLRNPASLFKRELFDKYGYYNTEYKCDGDRELFLRMYINGAVFQIDKLPLVVFNIGGISTKNRAEYAIPEGKKISLEYGMDPEYAEKYYKKMLSREYTRLHLKNSKIGKMLYKIIYSDSVYPIFSKIKHGSCHKLALDEIKKYHLEDN
ncbi:MAG: glycosyltransferase [Lachnospiraceae bacterium]